MNEDNLIELRDPPDAKEAVGTLKMGKDGRLTFEGDADKSAMVFFNEVIMLNNQHITSMESRIKKLDR